MIVFDKQGKENTIETLKVTIQKALELNISDIVIASNTGDSVLQLIDMIPQEKSFNMVCVTHSYGHKKLGENEFLEENKLILLNKSIKLLTGTHLFSNIERDVTNSFGGLYPGGIVSATLRCFGQGLKVCFEIATMALDSGLIPYGREVIVIGGTVRGCDTAAIIKPAHGKEFFNTRIREIICMPYYKTEK